MEESKTVFFRGEFTNTRENLRKFRWAAMFLDKYTVLPHAIALGLLLFVVFVGDADYKFYATIAVATLFIVRLIIIYGDDTYKRLTSRNDGNPLHVTLEFNNYHILNMETQSGNRYKFHYDQVSRIGQTEKFYLIFLQQRQCILLEKDSITREAGDDFIRFLCAACPNLKPKKLHKGIFGKTVFFALIVLLCLVLLGSIVFY